MVVRRLNSEALTWEKKFTIVMACSKFQLSANMKSKNLSLNEKIAVLDYVKGHPSQSYRKIAEQFNVGKTATAIFCW